MFETARLRLRAHDPADAAAYHEWWNDPQIVPLQSAGGIVPLTRQTNDERLKSWVKDSLIFCAVETIAETTLIGIVNLWGGDAKNRDYRLAILLGRPYWNQGFGREILAFFTAHAFLELGVHRISLQVAASNARAINCYRAVGFKEEGRLRQAVFCAGGWHDDLLMGMLREDLTETA
jgi:RimJ/RimL family protein N-acetyltransferase